MLANLTGVENLPPWKHRFFDEALAKNYLVRHGPDGAVWEGYSNAGKALTLCVHCEVIIPFCS